MEQERALLKKDIRVEFVEEIDQMRANILAYQDLLIDKETEIKAYAIQLANAVKNQGTGDQTALNNLKQIIEEQQTEIEALKRKQHTNCPKQLNEDQLNAFVAQRVLSIEKEYLEKTKDVSSKLLKEMHDLQKDFAKKEKKNGKLMDEQTRKHRLEIELKDKVLQQQQSDFDKKSEHWISL